MKEERETKKVADAARKAENTKLLVRHILPIPLLEKLYWSGSNICKPSYHKWGGYVRRNCEK